MWSQIAVICFAALSVNAHGIAVSHQSRIDGHSYGHLGHGNIGHLGYGPVIGHLGHGHHWPAVSHANIVHHDHHGHVGHLGHLGHLGHHGHAWSHPAYSFSYAVNDPHTGDHKSQHESRHGDITKGVYSLVQPDGHLRTVHYSSEGDRGFHANVHYTIGHRHHIPHHHHLH